jgi:hypothetical protein
VEEDAAARPEGLEGLLDEEPAFLGRPVVEDVRLEVGVGGREGVVPHVRVLCAGAALEAVAGDELFGDLAHRGQVEHDRLQVRPAKAGADRVRARTAPTSRKTRSPARSTSCGQASEGSTLRLCMARVKTRACSACCSKVAKSMSGRWIESLATASSIPERETSPATAMSTRKPM